jgi:uncharacterized protein YrrD
MTIKASEIIGNKIVSLQDGKEIGKIQDLVYDPEIQKIRALIIDKGGWFSEPKLIPIENIKNIGEDAVVVDSPNVIKRISEVDKAVASIAKNETYVTRTKIMTDTGVELGMVNDILFDSESGNVEKFEISQGGFKDLSSGKKLIDVSNIETIGHDTIIVKPETQQVIEKQAQEQGIRGAVSNNTQKAKEMFSDLKSNAAKETEEAKDKVKSPETQEIIDNVKENVVQKNEVVEEKTENVKEDVEDIGQNIQQKFNELTSTAKEKINEYQVGTAVKKRQDAVGRYLTINILSPDDELLAKRGDMITNHLLDQAESFGVLQQVLEHTSDSPITL